MGNHWYTTDGTPVHTMIGKNGKERDTTLRDAKKLNLIPSVTTVMKGVLAAPALEAWKMRTTLAKAHECPPVYDEEPSAWTQKIIEMAERDGKVRMDFGTTIHDALEKSLKGEELDILEVGTPAGETFTIYEFINPVLEMFADNGWDAQEMEQVLVGNGYAGTADVQYMGRDEYGIIDFKTTKDASKPFIPPTYPAQIALYHAAAHGGISDKAAGYNVFISTERNIGTVKAVRYDADRLRSEYAFGMKLVEIWQHLNNHTPEQ